MLLWCRARRGCVHRCMRCAMASISPGGWKMEGGQAVTSASSCSWCAGSGSSACGQAGQGTARRVHSLARAACTALVACDRASTLHVCVCCCCLPPQPHLQHHIVHLAAQRRPLDGQLRCQQRQLLCLRHAQNDAAAAAGSRHRWRQLVPSNPPPCNGSVPACCQARARLRDAAAAQFSPPGLAARANLCKHKHPALPDCCRVTQQPRHHGGCCRPLASRRERLQVGLAGAGWRCDRGVMAV